MRHDVLSDVLHNLKIAKDSKQSEIIAKPISKLTCKVLDILKKEKYIENYEIIKDKKGDSAKIKLTNQINDIGAIKPRFPVTLDEYEKYEKRYLPAKDFGRLILSTPKGLMTHIDAKEKKLGGVLIAYVY
ncbi:MAG: 30S ribosomal protein S8 [Candidatus Nanoarchaeia archaeon]